MKMPPGSSRIPTNPISPDNAAGRSRANRIIYTNQQFKKAGIAPVAYCDAIPFGWPGYELARQRPEWFRKGGLYDTGSLEAYAHNESRLDMIPCLRVTDGVRSPVDGKNLPRLPYRTAGEKRQALRLEAYRYDAAPLSLKDFPRVKNTLAHLSPPVGIGNNQAGSDMAGAGYSMQEESGRKFWKVIHKTDR